MTQWYVKDLSKLTGISVQTLHHYDRIHLLKPSMRLSNGYRVYSEKDLVKLQQILALKFFGFELSKIKVFLKQEEGALEHFKAQAQFLEEKAKTYHTASTALKSMIASVKDAKSIPLQTILNIMEIYKMTENLEKTWAGSVFDADELKQYAKFEAGLKEKFTKTAFTQKWLSLVDYVRSHIHKNPKSEFGKRVAKDMMDLVGGLYGKEHANLRHSIWEKGFKQGKMEGDRALEPEIVAWLDHAIDYYYRERICDLLKEVEKDPTSEHLEQQWHDLMTEMFGDSEELKQEAYRVGGSYDSRIGPKATKWIQQFIKSKV